MALPIFFLTPHETLIVEFLEIFKYTNLSFAFISFKESSDHNTDLNVKI